MSELFTGRRPVSDLTASLPRLLAALFLVCLCLALPCAARPAAGEALQECHKVQNSYEAGQ